MSADLTGSLAGIVVPDHILPSDHLTIPVVVHNGGPDAASLTPVVRLYASATGQVDSHAVLLGESAIKNTSIKAGKDAAVNVGVDFSAVAAPGAYSLVAVVDATNAVRESNEANNTTVAAKPLHIDWSFGSMAGHSGTDSITLMDANGGHVTFKLSGPGHGDVVRDGDAFDVHLTGTTASSKLSITATDGSCVATLDDLQVDGSLGALQASDANLTGLFSVGGTVKTIELGDIGKDAGVTIGGTGQAVRFTAGSVTGADVFSASPFDSISIAEWKAAGNDAGSIQSASIGSLQVDGDFAASLKLTGAAAGKTLGSAEIDGRVSSALWNVDGSAGAIEAGSTDAGWHGSFGGGVQSIETEGDLRGMIAAPSIGTIHVGGNIVGARILVGADLGSDGAPGGTGAAADHFSQAVLTQLRVDHSIRDSTILVGVDPVDGIYGNGNDQIVGGTASRIASLTVGGKLLGTTDITAGAFAAKVKIDGSILNPASVSQLHTGFPDHTPPQLSVSLAFDTGASASDGVTASATVVGSVADAGGIATFRAALDGSGAKDVRAIVNADGSFSFDAAALGTILGAPLADGSHTLALLASDAAGNSSNVLLSFTLDRSAPSIVAGLDVGSDTGTLGDQLTAASIVTLTGIAEAGTTVQLLGTGLTTIADAAGAFSFAGVALSNEGDNTFAFGATDLAGNVTTIVRTVTRDTSAPLLSGRLLNDTGVNNTDGWTTDPTLAGHVHDASNVVSLTVSFDGHGAETLAVPAPDFGYTLSADFLAAVAGGTLADGPHSMSLRATDAAGNSSNVNVDFILDRQPPTTPVFDLDAASDTGVPGDQHTTQSVVSLVGLADTGGTLRLGGSNIEATFSGNAFRFDGVTLTPGRNDLTVISEDLAGNRSTFTQSIFLDGGGTGTGEGPFPDLVVTSVASHLTGDTDPFGQSLLQVDWVTANTGSAVAHGRAGAWSDSVYLSVGDATPFNGFDIYLGSVLNADLAAGTQRVNSLLVSVPDWLPPGSEYHIYVVTDDEVGYASGDILYTANEVAEKTAGEYNNTTVEYVSSGIAPPPIAPSGTVLALDGTATAGSIDAPGETDVYTFDLNHQSKLYFDSLSSHSDVKWELQDAGDQVLFTHAFGASDAFGIGDANPLMNLQAGSYKIIVSGELAGSTDDYAFRLLDVDAVAAAHQGPALILDGGPLLGQHMDRGDRTDVYQFEATAGTHYVLGGLNDNTFEDQMVFRLLDPEGHQIWMGENSPSNIETFAETGTYTLLVEGNVEHTDAANYNVYIFTPQDRHATVPFVGQVHGFLDSPDQVNTYTFTLTEDSHLFFDGHLNSNGPYFNWTLTGEGITPLTGNTRFDSAGLMDVGTGTYTLTITGQDHASGWYDFTLMDVLHDPALLLNRDVPTGGFLAPGFTSALYHFDAHAGEHLSIAYNGSDPVFYDPATWQLIDSTGHVAFEGAVGDLANVDFDADGNWSLLVKGRQGNWLGVDYSVTLASGQGPEPLFFDLAPASDTGVVGDHHTTLASVTLAGTAAPNAFLTLTGTLLSTTADGSGAFQFANVGLVQGDNPFTVIASNPDGSVDNFSQTFVRDVETGGGGEPLPDLVVTNIDYQASPRDEFGNAPLHVEWTVANTGAATAHGESGVWYETIYASQNDTRAFTGDDYWIGQIAVNHDLAAGSVETHSADLLVPSFILDGYHLYVVVDEGNQVFEKTAGEYNNTTVDYVPSGIAPPPIGNDASALLLDGTAVAGTIAAPGETDIFTFTLDHASNLLFDSLSAHSDVKWELQDASGNVVFGRTFDQSDSFGMGDVNALLPLQAGDYRIVVSDTLAFGTNDYAFRLLDVNAVASHQLVLDGGPLLGEHLVRGDQTNVYQFDAVEGQKYVVGGPSDNTFEHGQMFRLFDPEGHQVWNSSTSPSDVKTFAASGTYTLVVEGNVEHTDPADYNVYVFTPQDRHYDLPPTGQQLSGFLDGPGQVNTYSFTLTEATSLFVDGVLGSNGMAFDWAIDGQGTHSSGNTSSDSALIEVGPGSYTVTIKGEGNAAGWFNFRLMDVLHDAATALPLDTPVGGSINPGFDSTLFRFDALAGQNLVVSLTTFDPDWLGDPAHWQLIDPQGHVALSGDTGLTSNFTASATGTWTVLVTGRQFNWFPVDYVMAISSPVAG